MLIYTSRFSPHVKTKNIRATTMNWKTVDSDERLHSMFPDKPIIANKRGKKFKKELISES